MARDSKDGRLKLGEPWATRLRAFRNVVGMGNTEKGVVREAIDTLIRVRTQKDKSLRSQYETELKRLNAERPVRLATKDGKPTTP